MKVCPSLNFSACYSQPFFGMKQQFYARNSGSVLSFLFFKPKKAGEKMAVNKRDNLANIVRFCWSLFKCIIDKEKINNNIIYENTNYTKYKYYEPSQIIPKFTFFDKVLDCGSKIPYVIGIQPSALFTNSSTYLESSITSTLYDGETLAKMMSFERFLPENMKIKNKIPFLIELKDTQLDDGPNLMYVPHSPCEDNQLTVLIKSAR